EKRFLFNLIGEPYISYFNVNYINPFEFLLKISINFNKFFTIFSFKKTVQINFNIEQSIYSDIS
ncbi:hypothetical protein BpHYR1_035996, partial [Brachionus plicatilis]